MLLAVTPVKPLGLEWGLKIFPIVIDVISWDDLMMLGRGEDESNLLERQRSKAVNQCATLVYTSGTTGMPKGEHD